TPNRCAPPRPSPARAAASMAGIMPGAWLCRSGRVIPCPARVSSWRGQHNLGSLIAASQADPGLRSGPTTLNQTPDPLVGLATSAHADFEDSANRRPDPARYRLLVCTHGGRVGTSIVVEFHNRCPTMDRYRNPTLMTGRYPDRWADRGPTIPHPAVAA